MFPDTDYRVVTISSGIDAILKAEEIKSNIVMADVFLPDKVRYQEK